MSAKQFVAKKFINVMDRVREPVFVPVPGFTVLRVTDKEQEISVDFVREHARPTGAFWAEWNDLTLGDLAGTAK